MGLETLPEKVRQSELAQALEEKLHFPQALEFDYWGQFKLLRDRVSAEVGEMKVLFPWFTPHNEEHHLSRLFGIADKMLGSARYQKMNAPELFLLACGLYAHDWGMAVGSYEIEYLRSGAKIQPNETFTPLDDEAQRLHDFAVQYGLLAPDSKIAREFDDDHLRAYVRYTHAWRSGVRARAFFTAIGASLPQALERVCQGHWLDFSDIDDDFRFSGQFSVLGDSVNLRAIALYVRLVDLLDIADDRTPYAIWRFVSPRDPKAQMEWKKHRALSPVIFTTYGGGRAVHFDGSTSDPEVWAELEDLRIYCEAQLAGSNDLLARHRDERHPLDLRKIEWVVRAERFTPVNISFQFDRERMFQILSDEIYQGDSYVFLRELLQNSIDAIRMRRELVQRRSQSSGSRRDVGLGFDDAIYFTVDHSEEGNATIRCRDYGIGMDEYVIRNYLSVAGRSYYQSDDFRYLGLKMDPISRFGIGILSCFMVAERIDIETFRDPICTPDGKGLRIEIPAVERQFRIYPAVSTMDVGTQVTVHVRGSKLRADVAQRFQEDYDTASLQLRVTEYLSAIAGFVEFPIVIDEGGLRSVILHPAMTRDVADAFSREGETVIVYQASGDYPWEEVFLPQDLENAKTIFRPQVLNVRELGLDGYEGTITYLAPTGMVKELENDYEEAGVISSITIEKDHELIIARHTGYFSDVRQGLTLSSEKTSDSVIFRNGILVADAPSWRGGLDHTEWPPPVLRINLPTSVTGPPDVSRRVLRGAERWDMPVRRKIMQRLQENEVAGALPLEPSLRLRTLAEICTMHHLKHKDWLTLLPRNCRPTLLIKGGGEITTADLPSTVNEEILEIPRDLMPFVLVVAGYNAGPDYRSLIDLWQGGEAYAISDFYGGTSFEIAWMRFLKAASRDEAAQVSLRFLKPPIQGLPPLTQRVFTVADSSDVDIATALRKGIDAPLSLTATERNVINTKYNDRYDRSLFLDAIPFEEPFSQFFCCSEYLNLLHPTTIFVYRLYMGFLLHRLENTLSAVKLGVLHDCLRSVSHDIMNPANLKLSLPTLYSIGDELTLFEASEKPTIPDISAYVWGIPRFHKVGLDYWHLIKSHLRPFGDRVIDRAPEELPPDLEWILEFSGGSSGEEADQDALSN